MYYVHIDYVYIKLVLIKSNLLRQLTNLLKNIFTCNTLLNWFEFKRSQESSLKLLFIYSV